MPLGNCYRKANAFCSKEEIKHSKQKTPDARSQQIRNKDTGEEKQMPEERDLKLLKSDRTTEA